MPPAGFEPATPGSDRPQTLALDRSATGIGASSRSARQQVISLHSGTLERHFIEKRDDSLKISSWENFGFTEGQSDTNHILFTRVVSSFGRYKDTRRASLVSDPLLWQNFATLAFPAFEQEDAKRFYACTCQYKQYDRH